MDCAGNTTSHSMMRGCAIKLSGQDRLPQPIHANSRRQARQTSDILILIATPAVRLRRFFLWDWWCPAIKAFLKGSPPVTTRPLLLGLELHGIRKEMVRLRCAA